MLHKPDRDGVPDHHAKFYAAGVVLALAYLHNKVANALNTDSFSVCQLYLFIKQLADKPAYYSYQHECVFATFWGMCAIVFYS